MRPAPSIKTNRTDLDLTCVFYCSAQANERKYVGEIHAKLLGYRTDGTRDAFLYNFRAREGVWYNLAA